MPTGRDRLLSLEQAYDGPIPTRLLTAARQQMARDALAPLPASEIASLIPLVERNLADERRSVRRCIKDRMLAKRGLKTARTPHQINCALWNIRDAEQEARYCLAVWKKERARLAAMRERAAQRPAAE